MGARWIQILTLSMHPRNQLTSEITTTTTLLQSLQHKPITLTTLLSSSSSFTKGNSKLVLSKRQAVYRKWKCLALEEERPRNRSGISSGGSLGKLLGEEVSKDKKKGTVAGAVALIIGTSIGYGILALHKNNNF